MEEGVAVNACPPPMRARREPLQAEFLSRTRLTFGVQKQLPSVPLRNVLVTDVVLSSGRPVSLWRNIKFCDEVGFGWPSPVPMLSQKLTL